MDAKERITDNIMTVWFLMGEHRRAAMHHGSFGGGRRPEFDPNRGRGRIIALLQLKDGISTKELANILDIRVSSLNETLAKMESAGLVERRPSEADRRVMLVYLTDEGREVEFDEPENIDLYKGFSHEELEDLEGYTGRMVANAEASFSSEFVEGMRERWNRHAEFFASAADPDRFPRPLPHFDDLRAGGGFGGFSGFDPRMGMRR